MSLGGRTNYRFTIGKKIGTGFGVVILAIVVVSLYTNKTLNESLHFLEQENVVYSPSEDALKDFKTLIIRSKMLISNWVHVQSRDDTADKDSLRSLIDGKYPALRKRIIDLSHYWKVSDQDAINILLDHSDALFDAHKEIMSELSTFESYEDFFLMSVARERIEDADGDVVKITNEILADITTISDIHRTNKEKINESLEGSSNLLRSIVRYFNLALLIAAIVIAFFTVRSIVKPIDALKGMLLNLGKGIIPKEKIEPTNDEVGEMSEAMNHLVDGLKRTTDFAKAVGSGNFKTDYVPLSKDDNLGHSLLAMRTDLYELTSNLEQKVKERTEEVVRQKEEIEVQKQKIEELYIDVTDSIRYAKRLQQSILPSDNFVRNCLPDSFVLFKPKDIVSGDFYWVDKSEDKVLFAAVDCTGHGVPGAFMSLVGHNGLDRSLHDNKLVIPARILDDLNRQTSGVMNKEDQDEEVQDGMDIAICSLDYKTMKLEFAGANNPLYIIRGEELLETKADKFAIGGADGDKHFTNHEIQLEKNDIVYIFSDGYADQFGGEKGKKFMYRQFRTLLVEIREKTMAEQKKILTETLTEWRGAIEQIDDIIVIGVRI